MAYALTRVAGVDDDDETLNPTFLWVCPIENAIYIYMADFMVRSSLVPTFQDFLKISHYHKSRCIIYQMKGFSK